MTASRCSIIRCNSAGAGASGAACARAGPESAPRPTAMGIAMAGTGVKRRRMSKGCLLVVLAVAPLPSARPGEGQDRAQEGVGGKNEVLAPWGPTVGRPDAVSRRPHEAHPAAAGEGTPRPFDPAAPPP